MSPGAADREFEVMIERGRHPDEGERLQVIIRDGALSDRIVICGNNGFRGYPDPELAYIIHSYRNRRLGFQLVTGQKNKKNTCCVFLILNQ